MRKRVHAIINPRLLAWARKASGYKLEEVAKRIGVRPEKIRDWESGVSKPTVIQLRNIASVYKRPTATFYLPKPPEDIPEINDFRILPGGSPIEESPLLLLEVRLAYSRREVALELAEELEEPIIPFTDTASIADDVDLLADRVRRLLDVSLEKQFAWKSDYDALNGWKDAIEDLGVLIFQSSGIPVQIMRGFSISEKTFPVIVLNSKDSPRGRIFTLLHEIGHLFLHNAGLCNLREHRRSSSVEQRVEVFCNRLAGAVLVPEDRLLQEHLVRGKTRSWEWQDAELGDLADKYSVSKEVILRRLLITGKCAQSYYSIKRQEFIEEGKRIASRQTTGFVPHWMKSVSNNGIAYAKMVLNAYYREIISASRLSDYLNVKLKHLASIEQRVFRFPRSMEQQV